MKRNDKDFFNLLQVRRRDLKNDDLFKIESVNYETLDLEGDQLIDLLMQILCWQRQWHLECSAPDYEDDVLKCIETLLEYYGGPNVVVNLSGGAQ